MSRDEEVFAEACNLPEAERAAFLSRACADDVALRTRVEKLLAGYSEAERMFATPIVERESPRSEEKSRDKLGRYKLLEKIGEGGCGTVWMAEQEEPVRRRVALKVIKLGMDTKEVIARFDAERQALALMEHPNIAKIFDAGTTESGRPFFVMEFVRGMAITRFCDERSFTTKQRLQLFIQVCHAIQHAHQKGIIHRDIKPSNILVTLHDDVAVPKVIDFGIAKATQGRLTDQTLFTAFEQFIGTPAYMSPEQVEYNALDVDTRSDVYSLGVLLYELLTGRPPFDPKALVAGGLDHIRKIIREVDPPRPSTRLDTLTEAERTTLARQRGVASTQLSTHLRGDLDWIAMRCLEKDRTRRYETANGLANDIQRHLDDEAVLARPPSAAYRFQKAFRRNRLIFTAAMAVAAALVIGLGVSTWQMLEARKAQRETELARTGEQQQRLAAQSAQKVAENEQLRADAQARRASESQEQSRRLLYATDMNLAQQTLKQDNLGHARRLLDRHRPQPGEEDLRGWEWRYLWQLTRSSALETLAHRPMTRGWSVSFSPDGTRLAVGWLDGLVDLWDIPGRRKVRSLTEREYPQHQGLVVFSPVRNLLVATSEPQVIKLYDLDSGRESILWRSPDVRARKIRNLEFSHDGSRVVVYAGISQKHDEVSVVNVSSGQIESRHETDFAPSIHGFLGAAQLSPDNRRLYLTRRYSIQCLDLAADQELWESDPEKDAYGMTTLAVSPDGRVLATCSGYEDPTIRIRNAATGEVLIRLTGHTGWVCQVVFSKDGRRLISAANDQTIRIWDTRTWTETRVLRGHTNEVHSVAISEPAQLIASAGKDGNLTLWSVDGKNATDGYRRLPAGLNQSQARPLDHSRVLLMPPGKPPELLDLKRDSPLALLPDIKSSADLREMSWSGPNFLCHWNGTSQILVHELRGAQFILRRAIASSSGTRPTWVDFNATRELLAWREQASSPASVYLESLATPGRRVEFKSDVNGLRYLRFSEDGKFLASAGEFAMRAWNVDSGQVVASSDEKQGDMAFAAGGRVLVAANVKGNAHEIGFYDLTQPSRAPRRVSGHFLNSGIAVSPDGGLVAINEGSQVRLFDPAKGESIGNPLHGHLNPVNGIAFSPDGRRLISSAKGLEAVKLWDVGTRQELLTLGGVGSILWSARWTADGDSILAGDPWQAWSAPTWEQIAAAEARETTARMPAER
jgi:serine/threonine protein kinase/WD40 repeat protein